MELHPVSFSMHEMLKALEAITAILNSNNLIYEVRAEDSLPPLVCYDRVRLEGILINLIGNAFSSRSRVQSACRAWAAGDTLFMSVTDTGKGIPLRNAGLYLRRFHTGG